MSKKERMDLILKAERILSNLRISAYYDRIKEEASSHFKSVEYLKSELLPQIDDMLIKASLLK